MTYLFLFRIQVLLWASPHHCAWLIIYLYMDGWGLLSPAYLITRGGRAGEIWYRIIGCHKKLIDRNWDPSNDVSIIMMQWIWGVISPGADKEIVHPVWDFLVWTGLILTNQKRSMMAANDLDRPSARLLHYDDVIMGTIASLITSLTVVYSTVYSDADQRKHQSSASLAIVWGIHRGPVNSPHQWPVTRKMFPYDDVIMHADSCVTSKTQEIISSNL